MKTFLLMLLAAFTGVVSSFGQLTTLHNHYRPGDVLIKQQVEYKDPGESGVNIFWDFSKLSTINKEYTVAYSSPSLVEDSIYVMGYSRFKKKEVRPDNLIIATEHNTMYYYLQQEDSLILLGHENPVVKLQYTEPYVMTVYSANFGRSIYSSYTTQGRYSGTESIKTQGVVETVADAFGEMILPSGDTISPVLRVKTAQTIIDLIKDEQSEKLADQKILETYRWYTKGYRYPIFEITRNMNLQDSTLLFGTCFFFPLQDHYYLDTDPENQKILDELWSSEKVQEEAIKEGQSKFDDYITYKIYPNPVKQELHIGYTMKETATVFFELYYINGALARKAISVNRSVGNHMETLNCSNLTPGSYILRIMVNNKFKSEKIIKR